MATLNKPFGDLRSMTLPDAESDGSVEANAERQGRGAAAVSALSGAAFEAVQVLLHRQAESMTHAIQSTLHAARYGVGIGDPVKHAEMVHKTLDKTMSDMRDLAQMTIQAQVDLTDQVTRLATEVAQDMGKTIRSIP